MYGNPLFERLTRSAKWPSLRVCLGLATLLVCTAALWSTAGGYATGYYLGCILWLPIWLLAVICPPIVAWIAASHTSRDVRGEEYQLLRLTPLPKSQIVRGYVWAALYRLRAPLAVLVGLTPWLIGGTLNLALYALSSQVFSSYAYPYTDMPSATSPYTLTTLDVIGPLAELVAVAAGMLTLNLLAAALGVMLALWWRKSPAAATGVASAASLFGALFGVLVMLTVLGPTIGGTGFSQLPTRFRELAVTVALCVLPPALLAWGAIALARRSV